MSSADVRRYNLRYQTIPLGGAAHSMLTKSHHLDASRLDSNLCPEEALLNKPVHFAGGLKERLENGLRGITPHVLLGR